MSDKLRRTFPVRVTHGDGEQPTGAKLNSISEQARNGLGVTERAIGDIWGQSGDAILSTTPLQIPNLARFAGENLHLNPAIFPTTQDFVFIDDLQIDNDDLTEGYFKFKPKGSITIDSTSGSFVGSAKSREDLVIATGDWWSDSSTGKFRCFTPITGPEVLSYSVGTTDEWISFKEVVPGVIPDPDQTNFDGVRFSTSAGSYYIHLPPREAITYSDSRHAPVNWPSAAHVANNLAPVGVPTPYRMWQDPSIAAMDYEHYRYSLPEELVTGWAGIGSGDRLPDGYMYLWNQSTNTVVEDAVFFKATDLPTQKYRVRVEAPSLDLGALATADETAASYSSGYSLITCGASLASAVWELKTQFLSHSHNNFGDHSPLISHSAIASVNPPTSTFTTHSSRYPTYLPAWAGSAWANDEHTSLLSRGGSQTDLARARDLNNNAMLGNLLLPNSVATAGVFLDSANTNNSFKLFFGDVTGPSIYGASATEIAVSGNIVPIADSLNSIGTTGVRWENLWVDDANITNDLVVGRWILFDTFIKFWDDYNGTPTLRLQVDNNGALTPGVTSAQDVGSTSLKWSKAYFDDIKAINIETIYPGFPVRTNEGGVDTGKLSHLSMVPQDAWLKGSQQTFKQLAASHAVRDVCAYDESHLVCVYDDDAAAFGSAYITVLNNDATLSTSTVGSTWPDTLSSAPDFERVASVTIIGDHALVVGSKYVADHAPDTDERAVVVMKVNLTNGTQSAVTTLANSQSPGVVNTDGQYLYVAFGGPYDADNFLGVYYVKINPVSGNDATAPTILGAPQQVIAASATYARTVIGLEWSKDSLILAANNDDGGTTSPGIYAIKAYPGSATYPNITTPSEAEQKTFDTIGLTNIDHVYDMHSDGKTVYVLGRYNAASTDKTRLVKLHSTAYNNSIDYSTGVLSASPFGNVTNGIPLAGDVADITANMFNRSMAMNDTHLFIADRDQTLYHGVAAFVGYKSKNNSDTFYNDTSSSGGHYLGYHIKCDGSFLYGWNSVTVSGVGGGDYPGGANMGYIIRTQIS